MTNPISLKATNLMAAAIAIVVFSVTSPAPATAATISYDLTGDPNNLIVQNGNNGHPHTIETILLTNAATGLNQVPGFILNVNDMLSGTLTLSSPFTMPASTAGANYAG